MLVHVEPKSPFGAAVLSALLPGVGQVYAGELWRGIRFIAVFLIVLVYLYFLPYAVAAEGLTLVMYVAGLVRSFRAAVRWNAQHGVTL